MHRHICRVTGHRHDEPLTACKFRVGVNLSMAGASQNNKVLETVPTFTASFAVVPFDWSAFASAPFARTRGPGLQQQVVGCPILSRPPGRFHAGTG